MKNLITIILCMLLSLAAFAEGYRVNNFNDLPEIAGGRKGFIHS